MAIPTDIPNYLQNHGRLAAAILTEFRKASGHWPSDKAKLRRRLTDTELRLVARVAAAAVLDIANIQLIPHKPNGPPQ